MTRLCWCERCQHYTPSFAGGSNGRSECTVCGRKSSQTASEVTLDHDVSKMRRGTVGNRKYPVLDSGSTYMFEDIRSGPNPYYVRRDTYNDDHVSTRFMIADFEGLTLMIHAIPAIAYGTIVECRVEEFATEVYRYTNSGSMVPDLCRDVPDQNHKIPSGGVANVTMEVF